MYNINFARSVPLSMDKMAWPDGTFQQKRRRFTSKCQISRQNQRAKCPKASRGERKPRRARLRSWSIEQKRDREHGHGLLFGRLERLLGRLGLLLPPAVIPGHRRKLAQAHFWSLLLLFYSTRPKSRFSGLPVRILLKWISIITFLFCWSSCFLDDLVCEFCYVWMGIFIAFDFSALFFSCLGCMILASGVALVFGFPLA